MRVLIAFGICIKSFKHIKAVLANLIQGKVQPFFSTVCSIRKSLSSYLALMHGSSALR